MRNGAGRMPALREIICRSLAAAALLLWFSPLNVDASVSLGIDNFQAQGFPGLEGKRVGLVTNPSGVNAAGVSTIQVLERSGKVRLVALFGPEHGLYGTVKAGDAVANQRDPATGLPVYSLFGDTRKPTPQMLQGLDVLVYDLQDIGVRSYTFISTLGLVMQAAAEQGIEVVILDRPNPLGGIRIEGGGVSPGHNSFVGQYDIPYVYGLTPGELAWWINERWLAKPCRLKIFKMSGWTRSMTWDRTGLKWVPTSPNIPRADCAFGYVATGLLGDLGVTNGANVSSYPFEVVADQNLDPVAFTRRFNALGLPGVYGDPFSFYPTAGKFKTVQFRGLRLAIDPQARTNLLSVNFQILDLLRELRPDKNYFAAAAPDSIVLFDKINGGPGNRLAWTAGRNASDLMRTWQAREIQWRVERQKFLLYP
ncbi:MAG: DUF1343 domain-containing protein [Methylacidiphilales bacterium]|nr:DUF1343 domain-containing protein [Candidatus Methylacidiphilales bacterium]